MQFWNVDFMALARDLCVTFFGAFIGVLGGWLYSTKVSRSQLKKQNEEIRNGELKLLVRKFERVAIELRNNKYEVKKLGKTLGEINHLRADMWEWAETIVDAFSFKFYDNLLLSGLNKHLPKQIDDELFNSYDMIYGIQNMVKQSIKANYYYGHAGDKETVNQFHHNAQTYTSTVYKHLDYSVDMIYNYKDKDKDKDKDKE